jgi:hypothetical protein
MPAIGVLNALGQNDAPNLLAAFRRGLGETGYIEARNAAIEYRFAENQHDRLPTLAADLVGRKVNVIAATGGGAAVLAAMAATNSIPIVFMTGGDPVREGYVRSLNRPGGNVTGVSWFTGLVASKGLGLLHELVPNAALIALLTNPKLPESARILTDALEAARGLGRQLLLLNASTPSEIDVAFATMRERRANALYVGGDPFFFQPPPANRCFGGARRHPGHVRQSRIRRRGRADQLRQRQGRWISSRRSLRGAHSQWRQARRPAGRSGHQVRTRRQCQSRESGRLTIPESFLARADEVIE